MTKHEEAQRLLEEALKGLESTKGSVSSSVQKLSRAAELVGDEDIRKWCAVQLGDPSLTRPLEEIVDAAKALSESKAKAVKARLAKSLVEAESLG
jgi:hypothetical protein